MLDISATHLAGRVPLIVTCSHFSTRIAVEKCVRAEAAGAEMLMLMPPYHGALLKADEPRIVEHFQAIADAVSIPLMVQDAPLSGVQLSVPFLARLAQEIPRVDYLKVEMPGTAGKLRGLIDAAGDSISGPFDGEESIALLPELIKDVVTRHARGDRAGAKAAYAHILPLINFENRQCGFRACKTVMQAG